MEFTMPGELCTIELQSGPWVIEAGSWSVAQAGLERWTSGVQPPLLAEGREHLLPLGELLPPAESCFPHTPSVYSPLPSLTVRLAFHPCSL